jgi:histidinol dehydrogenase
MKRQKAVSLFTVRDPREANAFVKIIQERRVLSAEIAHKIDAILSEIRTRGDAALFELTEKFDKVRLTQKTVRLDPAIVAERAALAPRAYVKAVQEAAKRIRAYHARQKVTTFSIKTPEGVLSQVVRPLRRVALYVPGGVTMYPSSVLMCAIPARLAGVREIVVVTPPRNQLAPEMAYVLKMLGIREIYQVGGAQAIAALAYGTKSIPAVDKIVGPGNSWVALAKKAVFGTVDIDMVAGPSEVAVAADPSTPASAVALELLAQAEHGSGDEMAIAVAESAAYGLAIVEAIEKQIESSPVQATFKKLKKNAICVCVTGSRRQTLDLINVIAPEHLVLMTKTCAADLASVTSAGAVFLGRYTPVASGDYFIGTNHVLPTAGAGRYASPLGVESFMRRMSVASLTRQGLAKAAPMVSILARTEQFIHHALSVERLDLR